MGSTFSGIEALISSLRAQSMAQRLISHNIANATTRGFSRQLPILTSLPPINYLGFNTAFGVQQVGSGVSLSSIARIRDEFLDLQIRFELSTRGQQEAILEAAQAMQILFPEINAVPGAGLVTAVDRFFDDWTALAAVPTDATLRATLANNAQNMASLFNSASRTLLDIQRTTDDRVRDSITQINNLLSQVAEANAGIIRAQLVGGVANDLMDKRDVALADLAELIKIDAVKLADGSILVMTGNARTLVRGGSATQLVAAINPHEPQFANVGLRDLAGGTITDITAEITGGKIAGQIIARDQIVAGQLLEIDKLAHSLIEQVNLLHRAGYDLTGLITDTPLFSGTEARDIAVNSAVVANPDLLAASRLNGVGTNGQQAESIGLLAQMIMNATFQSGGNIGTGVIDPTSLIGVEPFAVAPAAAGTLVINGVSIAWNAATDSIETIIGNINVAMLGLGVRASYDSTQQKLTLFSDRPLTVYDSGGNLTAAFDLQTKVSSLSPANNGVGPLDRSIDPLVPINASELQYRTLAGARGTLTIQWQDPVGTQNSENVAWNAGQSLDAILTDPVTGINTLLGTAGAPFRFTFNVATQKFETTNTNVIFDVPTQTYIPIGPSVNVLPASLADPISQVTLIDTVGNLSQVFNLEAQPTFGSFNDGLLAQMQALLNNAQAVKDQADAAVAQLELQQDAIAKVNLDEERSRLLEYLRAYEAAVRALAVLDEMLNVLINKMAVTSSGTSSGSVLTI